MEIPVHLSATGKKSEHRRQFIFQAGKSRRPHRVSSERIRHNYSLLFLIFFLFFFLSSLEAKTLQGFLHAINHTCPKTNFRCVFAVTHGASYTG